MNSVDIVHENGIIVTLPSPEIPEEVKDKASHKAVIIEFMMVQSKQETIQAIAGLLAAGILKPAVYKTFPFKEIRKAHLEVETNRVAGKVVVTL